MTDETVDQSTVRNAGEDDPRVAVLQAVFDRVDSWEDGADAATVREELDKAVEKSDIEIDDDLRERIVRHIVEDTSHGDVRRLLD
jgi:hypothetical protein